jgi:ABC-2 type transport system permease protein
VVLTGLLAASASVTAAEYPTAEDRVVAAQLIASSPALLLLRGPAADASTASLIMADVAPIVAAMAALMSAPAVIRHTRHNEETGRAKLVGSAAVGRLAMPAAALIVAVGASLALGTLFVGVLLANALPLGGGALAVGAALAAVAASFAAVAALTAQLTATARAASALAGAVIAGAYLIRGLGDLFGAVTADGTSVTPAWPLWLSPFGWAAQVRSFDGPNWWLFAPSAALFVAVAALALFVAARRDVGFGLIPPRRGPAVADRGLLSPLGLAWRLQRGLFIGWAVGLSLIGAVFGSLGEHVGAMAGNEQFRAILDQLARGQGGDLADLFFSFVMGIVGMAATVFAVQALLTARAEEADGRLEPILGTAVPRVAWIGSHIAEVVLGILALLVLAGASAGLAYGLVAGDLGARIAELVPAALIQAPAVLVLAGIAVTAFGLLPALSSAVTWAAAGAVLLLTLLGDLLELPDALLDLSPFSHLPELPAADLSPGPILALLAVAAGAIVIGLVGFRRRDLAVRP